MATSPPKFDESYFGDLGRSTLAEQLWRFLNAEENVIRLIVASELRHVALDGVVLALEKKFGAVLKDNRVRQMIGAMVKQVMAPRGWGVAEKSIKVRFGEYFTVAARYEQTKKVER